MTSSSLHGHAGADRFTDRPGSDKVAELANEHPGLVTLAKTGWLAKGVVYLIVGVLAVPIAFAGLDRGSAGGDEEASQRGAVAEIAESPFGATALWLVAIGLGLYVLWRLFSIALPAPNTAKAWATRAGYVVSAIVYASLAWSAISLARRDSGGSAGQQSEESRVDSATRDLMEMGGGRWLVGIIGLVLLAVGVAFIHRGITAGFRRELEPGGVGPIGHQSLVRLGQAGWIGRGVMMLLLGWFVTQAAIQFDPDEARGIDGALREATGSTLGALLALVVAIGLVIYGVFCLASAPRARLTGAA